MKNLSRVFKALSNENRLKVFEQIRKKELCCKEDSFEGCCVGDVAERFPLALSTISHHLKELRSAGLIVCEKRGQWVYCRVNHGILREAEDFLKGRL
ncbi:MAG TPA: metalloregulator ArsR/SmtB family transcription factor [bacterium]|nr:metalloregulator ArsR/SmtB family transcription factor [bacterium]